VRTFLPAGEAAQADYEQLRAAVITGCASAGPAAVRFELEGLFGLICRPAATAVFTARLWAAARPPWTPYGDPRSQVLADAYQLLVDGCHPDEIEQETGT
jgi:hypothetical protein